MGVAVSSYAVAGEIDEETNSARLSASRIHLAQALEKYQDIIRQYIRGRHGIYALYRKGKLQYVGLASNLRARLHRHLRDRHKDSWDHFSVYLTIDNRGIKELETLLLRIVSPSGNRVGGKFVRSQNLAVQLRRDIRAWHREQEQLLVPVRRKAAGEKKVRVERQVGGKAPLAAYVSEPKKMRVRYKGKLYRARIRRDGTILYDSVVYQTPSAAGMAVRKRATNGWQFWQYERATRRLGSAEHDPGLVTVIEVRGTSE